PSCALHLFHATAASYLYTLSLHDALPIYFPVARVDVHDRRFRFTDSADLGESLVKRVQDIVAALGLSLDTRHIGRTQQLNRAGRSEEHTSELQSRENLVCRLLLEKKKIRL